MARARDHWLNEIRAVATSASGSEAWIEKVTLETASGASLEELLDQVDAVSGLLRSIQVVSVEDTQLAELTELFTDLQAKLLLELRSGEDHLDLSAPDTLRAALADAKQLLISRLMHTGGR